jgi:CheY-like chemotaxis protein
VLVNDPNVSEALQRVNTCGAIPQDIPVIICSIPGPEDVAETLGAADYLLKPVSREMLLRALDRLERPVRTVLVVDDEPDAVRMFQRMLVSAGRHYRVRRAFDGQQALEIMRKQAPDAVLLDLTMPRMDGFGFLSARSQDPRLCEIPVLLVTARDPQGQPILSNALAVTRGKGLSVHQLLESIRALNAILSPVGPTPSETPPG